MKYSKQQKDAIKKYYPDSNYEKLFKYFPNLSKRDIKSIASRMGIKSNNPGHRIDLTNQKFGRLIVLEIDHIDKNSTVFWKCRCECGKECIARSSMLRNGKKQSCGCLKREVASKKNAVDHCGERFGMLTAIERFPNYQGKGRTYYRCVCDCGNERFVSSSGLVSGKTKTCGCLSRKPKDFKKVFDLEHDDTIKRYLIYKHTAPNGKVYIGITKQDAERRWQNGNGYNTQKKFWKAIQKYGWKNFTHEILETDLTEKEACEKEMAFIEQYKSINPKFGYNTSEGGDTGRSLVTPVMQYYHDKPVNFFESHRQAAKLLSVSDSTINNYIIGTSMIEGYRFETMPAIHTYDIDTSLYDIRDEKHFCIGKMMREQQRENTIARNKSNIRGICQYDMDGHFIRKFSSITEAQNSVEGLGSIGAALKGSGKSKSAGGFQWKYDTGDYSDISALHVNGRPVLQIDPKSFTLIAEYHSMADAERETGISNKQIIKSCKRQHITSGGFIWRYKDDPDAFVPVKRKKEQDRFRIPVNQYSLDGQYIRSYKSITEAEKINSSIKNIGAVVSEKAINKSAGGYMWRIDIGDHRDIEPYHANGRYVDQIDMETGKLIKRYPSIRAAHRETGINNIAEACVGKRKSAGGYIWQFVKEE